MKKLIVNLLVWALRPVVMKVVAEMPSKPVLHLTGEYTEADLEGFRLYWKKITDEYRSGGSRRRRPSDKASSGETRYEFELPVGARVYIGENVFLHSGGGVFVGEKCPLIIECSLSESQLLGAKEKSFNVQKYESGNEVLAREIYLASGDIASASAMIDAVSSDIKK